MTDIRKYNVVYWRHSLRSFVIYERNLSWNAAKDIRDEAKESLDFPHNPDVDGIHIYSTTVCEKNGIK